MDVWVIVKGEYADRQVVGVVLNDREGAERLAKVTQDLSFDEAISVLGPFQPTSALDWVPQAAEPADNDVEWVCRVAGCNDC